LKVLLVEDDEGARLLYHYMMAVAGHKVNAVRNGLEAFAEIQVNRPNVILAQLASRADKLDQDFAAGRLNNRDLLIIIIGIAALILVIVAVR
jgi:CheY-like chemotaxis protein